MKGRTATTRRHRLFDRRCVACGYDGDRLQQDDAARCARCGCDLRQRPPRSYAEMEGLASDPRIVPRPTHFFEPGAGDPARLIERWLLFLFLALIIFFAIAALAFAAMNP